MECLTGRQCIHGHVQRMFRVRSICGPPLRSAAPVVSPRLWKRSSVRAEPGSTRAEFGSARIPDNVLPPIVGDTSAVSHPIEQQALFADIVDQTVYVEKGSAVQSISTSEMIHHPEVVPDSPSFSLVRSAQQPDTISETKRIFSEILGIAVPALGTVLADPLMSLVDTACVGQISAVQLAALGPNTAIFNMIFAVFGVMGVALANRLAQNSMKAPGLSKEEMDKRREQNETTLCHTLVLAIGVGIAVTSLLFACGPMLLRWMGTSASVMKPALDYLLIRAIASPAVLLIGVAQGACLGQQDMWTPLKVILVAGLVNLLGDIALIMFMGFGTIGAAAATAAAQIAGGVFFFLYLRRGGANGKAVKLKWKGFPTMPTLKPILDMGRVLVSRNFVLMLAYTGMTAVATSMGTLTLAAHQVALQLFWFMSYVPEPLSLTAQSLLARDRNDKAKTKSVSQVLVGFGAMAGLLLAAVFSGTLAFAPRCFTADLAVIAAFQKLIPHGTAAIFLCAVSSMFDGISIGSSQYEHLPSIMYASTAMTLAFQWATMEFSLGLSGIWMSQIIFFASRNLLHVAHLIRNWDISPFSALTPSYSLKPLLTTE